MISAVNLRKPHLVSYLKDFKLSHSYRLAKFCNHAIKVSDGCAITLRLMHVLVRHDLFDGLSLTQMTLQLQRLWHVIRLIKPKTYPARLRLIESLSANYSLRMKIDRVSLVVQVRLGLIKNNSPPVSFYYFWAWSSLEFFRLTGDEGS